MNRTNVLSSDQRASMDTAVGISPFQREILIALYRLAENSDRFFQVSARSADALVRRGLAEQEGKSICLCFSISIKPCQIPDSERAIHCQGRYRVAIRTISKIEKTRGMGKTHYFTNSYFSNM